MRRHPFQGAHVEPHMDQPWTQTRTELLVSSPWLTVEKNDYRVGDRPLTDYFIVRRQPFVLVVARAPQGIILIRQYRPATGRWYWSLPAGYLEPGEPVVAAAARELFEETAVRGSGFSHVGTLDPLPAYVASAAHVVTCDVAEAAALQPANDEADDVAVRSWSDIATLIADGVVTEMQAVAALLLVRLGDQEGRRRLAPHA